jgi:hypothetical protein
MNLENLAVIKGKEHAEKILDQRRNVYLRNKGKPKNGILVAEGDSWFDYPGSDILDVLEDNHGYDVERVSNAGDRIEEMAYSDGQLEDFTRRIEKVLHDGQVPTAIMLSGGGNDLVGDCFKELLNHASAPNRGLNEQVVSEYIDVRIRAAYIHIISAINTISIERFSIAVPIITHGYDYSVPDGRGKWWLGPWLEPGFRAKGYLDIEENKSIVETLINRFYAMMQSLNSVSGFENVAHLDLRGLLPNDDSYKEWWDNEMHPEKQGFERIGDVFAQYIAAL